MITGGENLATMATQDWLLTFLVFEVIFFAVLRFFKG